MVRLHYIKKGGEQMVQETIQAVKDAGLLDDTIFILTSDHGGIDKGHGGKTMQEMETAKYIQVVEETTEKFL